MLEDLFLTETPGETSTSTTELPEDIELWPAEIQNMLYTQVPVLANVPGQLTFDTVDQDKRYAKGAYVVDTGAGTGDPNDNIIFPILVKNGELIPTDVYMYKDEFRPVDTDDISAILMSPEIGTETMDPEDIPSTAYSNFSNRVTPPGAYGSGYVTSYNSKTGSVNEKLVDMIQNSDYIKRRLATNKTAQKKFLARIDEENTEKVASSGHKLEKDAIIFIVNDGLFTVKTAGFKNGEFYSDECEMTRGELNNWMKEAELDSARIIEDLKKTSMAFSWMNEKTASSNLSSEVASLGSYEVINRGTGKTEYSDVSGYVKTASGEKRYLAILKDGNYALQRDIYGIPVDAEKTASIFKFAAPAVGKTITMQISDDGEFAPPTKITSITGFSTKEASGLSVNGTSCRGRTAFIFLKNAGVTKPVKAGFVPDVCFVEKSAEAWFVPMDYPVLDLNKEEYLVKSAEDKKHREFLQNNGKVATESVRLWDIGTSDVAMKIASHDPVIIEKSAALNLIHKYADNKDMYDAMEKMASGKVISFDIDKGTTKKASGYIRPLTDRERLAILKVAASIEDEETIDSVLGLNYIDSENMDDFKESIPDLKSAENILAKLLLSTRLGNSTVDEADVQSVITSLHEIIKALSSRI